MVGVPGRSKGCKTCRQRHVKCDEAKPTCQRCIKAGFQCLGYGRETLWIHTSTAPFKPSASSTALATDGRRLQRRAVQPRMRASPDIPAEMSLAAFEGDFCFSYIFSNFVWKGYGSLWLDQAAEGKLGQLALDAATALAQSTFGRSKNVASIRMRGEVYYGKSLQALAEQLEDTQAVLARGGGHGLVVPVLVLMMHASTLTDRTAATFHLQGLSSIIDICGPEAFQHQPLLNALEAARATIVVASLVTRKHTFIDGPRWRSVPWALEPQAKTPQSYLLDLLASVPGILEDMDRSSKLSQSPSLVSHTSTTHKQISSIDLSQIYHTDPGIQESPAPPPPPIVERVVALLQDLYRWRWQWQARFGRDVAVDRDLTFEINGAASQKLGSIGSPRLLRRLHFGRAAAAADLALYNAVLIWLLALMWDLEPVKAGDIIEESAKRAMKAVLEGRDSELDFGGSHGRVTRYTSFEPLRRPGASVSVRDPALEICQVFEWQSRNHGAGAEANFMYMFPIGMAVSVLDTDAEVRSWIQILLDANPVTRGYGGYSARHTGSDNVGTAAESSVNSANPSVEGFGLFVTREILDVGVAREGTSPGLVHLLLLRGRTEPANIINTSQIGIDDTAAGWAGAGSVPAGIGTRRGAKAVIAVGR
ncbi:Transposase tc1-like protein [Pleurostoma richardsiae]|uniref:Transposase tc1-like protein n=1 Tax=Pleurostoma richardsiae TaxID=41990 RepID=A0AA38REE4_9PEZI|nr:Transposase tc1-like protein [Pleurostoma richardsiae]